MNYEKIKSLIAALPRWARILVLSLGAIIAFLFALFSTSCAFSFAATKNAYYMQDTLKTPQRTYIRDSSYLDIKSAGNIQVNYPQIPQP